MELAIFMDDSSDARHQEIVVAGAAFGLPEKWFDVERFWNRELKRIGLESFHATECESLRDQFKKFRVEGDPASARRRADQVRLDLIDIANAGGIVYAAVGIRRDDWKAAIAKDQYAGLRMPDDPVFFAYHLLMIQCMTRIANHHKFSMAAFVCDGHNRYKLAQQAYRRLKELNPSAAKHMGSIDHRRASDHAPLQIADLVAHESRLFMLGDKDRPSGIALRKSMFYGALATTEWIENMLNVQDARMLLAHATPSNQS